MEKINELSLEGLKALVYDLSEDRAKIDQTLKIINAKIVEKIAAKIIENKKEEK